MKKKYEIEKTIRMLGAPTMENLGAHLLSSALPALALVRGKDRSKGEEYGMIIAMRPLALPLIGEELLEMVKTLPQDPRVQLSMTTSDSVTHIFDWMRETGECWCAADLKTSYGFNIYNICLLGDDVCRMAERILDAARIPVQLRDLTPEGWTE